MKKSYIFILLTVILASCNKNMPTRVDITDWQFQYKEQWYPSTVPSFIHTDLMDNGLIPDPYFGTNEDSVRWVGDSIWQYKTIIPKRNLPAGDTLWLVFEGLAGQAVIAINDELYNADNMFCQYEFPITRKHLEMNDSGLSIELTFWPITPNRYEQTGDRNAKTMPSDSTKEAQYGITLPDRRAFTRIAPYQQGWDWDPKMPSCGIWKPVYITNHLKPQEASIDDVKRAEESRLKAKSINVKLIQRPDSIGRCFTFFRDGKPIFIKGANWIPVHSFPVLDSKMKERYRHLLCSAKEAGFNMLRVWGGGIYEHDYFFDLCDSLDIMVWMDFNFSTMLYPDNNAMLASIRNEAYQNVKRIAKHPCVVLWCGNNEVKNGWEDWGWQGVYKWSPEQRKRLEKAMDTIFGYPNTTDNTSSTSILAQAIRDCDPMHRPYITTSPLYGWGHPECVTHGDSHYWGVWWGEEHFEKYAEKTGRFMSEFGFQSYPMMSTIGRYAPEALSNEWRTKSFNDALQAIPALRSHQKHPRGVQIIDKAMKRYYGFDSHSLSLEDYVYVSQLLQAWGTGYGIFQHIKQQPHCMGTLYWQLNDCWPVASWSSIDYYGNWKALHYRVKALYADNVDLAAWEQYYSIYPKKRIYDKAVYELKHAISDSNQSPKGSKAHLEATVTAKSNLYDVYLDTEPHIDGHFSNNFFDLKAGEKKTVTFCPVDPTADIRNIKVTVRTLNELYAR